VIRRRYSKLYQMDAAVLRALPVLAYYAGIRVLEVTKT
jgi:hypothetical protein